MANAGNVDSDIFAITGIDLFGLYDRGTTFPLPPYGTCESFFTPDIPEFSAYAFFL